MSVIKYLLKANLELTTPLCIGSGESEDTNSDIIIDSEGKPYIPASSFSGKLYSELDNVAMNLSIWGSKLNQSRVRCSDLTLIGTNFSISHREGIKIVHQSGLVDDGGLFDYQILEPGISFELQMEFDKVEKDLDMKPILSNIQYLLLSGMSVGAHTSKGLGLLRVNTLTIHQYNLSEKNHSIAWLLSPKLPGLDITSQLIHHSTNTNFKICADFSLVNSLIVRTYPHDSSAPDNVQLMSNGNPIIPGSSLKGVLRARARKILNTLSINPIVVENCINDLFGYVSDKKDVSIYAIPSRFIVREEVLDADSVSMEQQTRIKIDQFTGGTIKGALLETMPIFNKLENKTQKNLTIQLEIKDAHEEDAGLALLLLKDLWTRMLPIGGEKSIGRGVLQGLKAEINWKGKTIAIDSNSIENSCDMEFLNEKVISLQKLSTDNNPYLPRLQTYGYKEDSDVRTENKN